MSCLIFLIFLAELLWLHLWLYFFLFKIYLFWLCWVFTVAQAFLSLQVGATLCGVKASHCSDFFCWGVQVIGHLMRRVDSLEKTLMLGGIGGRRRRGRQRMRWLDASPTQWT